MGRGGVWRERRSGKEGGKDWEGGGGDREMREGEKKEDNNYSYTETRKISDKDEEIGRGGD